MKVRAIKEQHINAELQRRKNTRILLHKILLNVRNQYDQNRLKYGICDEVKLRLQGIELISQSIPYLRMLFKDWPEYSCDNAYPVPSYSIELDAQEAYYNLPSWYKGEYAAARLRLLDYLIEQTK